MERPQRPTRKRKAVLPDSSSDEETSTRKLRKIVQTPEKVTKKRAVKMGNLIPSKKKPAPPHPPPKTSSYLPPPKTSSSLPPPAKLANKNTSEVYGPIVTKTLQPKKTELKETSDGVCNNMMNYSKMWDEAQMLSYVAKVEMNLAKSFVGLLNEGCSLPFIARYRKGKVNNLMPDRLQELFECYQNVTQLKKKVKTVIETLKNSNKLTPEVEKSILNSKSLAEVDLVYAPLKSHTQSLAAKARNLGLEPAAIRALSGEFINVKSLCTNDEELCTEEKVDKHLTHIVADIIHKDTRVLEYMRKLKEETRFTIQSTRTKSSTQDKESKNDKKSDPETYKLYFEWKCLVQFVKPHQTLAINRGEDENILSVKVIVPDWFHNKLERFCLSLWNSGHWVSKGLADAYNRLIKPWLTRQVRAGLTNLAHKEAVKTFTTNLEKYLLTEPIKNRVIVGLDPGFRAGCKVGIINANGEKLEACTLFPNFRMHNPNDPAARQLKDLIRKHQVQLIGLGNGTACRETETWLKSHHISNQIPVVIVPEQGASIYSISKEAQKEHPNMDPNLISALSIARRVLDPLGELIKVEPKNLGVGLYQHDIPTKMLETALDCSIEKVVSLVGVDLNTASLAMLRRISGLSEAKAKKILEYRQQKRGFTSRAELQNVSGIGKVTFQQCAGFLKVLGGPEPLDATIVHPESYNVAKMFAKKINVSLMDISKPNFPRKVETAVSGLNLEQISKDLNTDICTLELIINAFKQKVHEDNVISFCKPVYSLAVQATEHITEGMSLTGVVRNVVPFGCFVDCGVGDNGLIHRSKLMGNVTPKLGDRVAVTVIPSTKPNKLQLKLDRILD